MNDGREIKILKNKINYMRRNKYYQTIGAKYQTSGARNEIQIYMHNTHHDTAYTILNELIMYANKINVAVIKRGIIAKDIHASTRTVTRGLKYLADIKCIKIIGKSKGQMYFINPCLSAQCSSKARMMLQARSGMPNAIQLIKNLAPHTYNHYASTVHKYGYKHIDIDSINDSDIAPSHNVKTKTNKDLNNLIKYGMGGAI